MLKELHASLRGAGPGLPFQIDRRALQLGDHFTLSTDAGPLDCLATPAGTNGFAELAPRSVILDIDGVPVRFAHLDDLIRMKRAAGRPKDRIEIEVLEALRQRRVGHRSDVATPPAALQVCQPPSRSFHFSRTCLRSSGLATFVLGNSSFHS